MVKMIKREITFKRRRERRPREDRREEGEEIRRER